MVELAKSSEDYKIVTIRWHITYLFYVYNIKARKEVISDLKYDKLRNDKVSKSKFNKLNNLKPNEFI